MAKAAGISYSSIQRIWQAHGLKPHLVKTFKVSRDKNFAAKVTDVVGLYLNPPEALAQVASSLPSPLHADLGVLAQYGGALLCRDHPQTHPAQRLQEYCRAQERHHRIPGEPQCRPQTLHLDKIRQRNSRKSRSGETSVRVTTLAARLQGIAEPNAIVIADETRQLLGRLFDLEDLGARFLKGMANPIPAWRVVGERAAESRFEAGQARRATGFFGREREVDLLMDRWVQAQNGEGQVILLSGEAGIGKSRIVATLRQKIADEAHTRNVYQCSPHHTNSPLYPV